MTKKSDTIGLSLPDVPEMMHETSLLLLRHGESTFNARGLYQGCSDEAELTDKGRAATRATADLLKRTQFAAVYVSPLRRARETATTLQECIPELPASEVRNELREIDLSAWEGMPLTEVRVRFADDWRMWKLHPERLRMRRRIMADGAASLATVNEFAPALDVRDRARRFLDYVQSHHPRDRLLVVAHGGFNRALISAALELPVSHQYTIAQSNCAMNLLKRPASGGEWSLHVLNLLATSKHLPTVREEIELQLFLTMPNLAQDIASQYSFDAVIGEQTAARLMMEQHKKLQVIVPNDAKSAESWWNTVDKLRQDSAQKILLIANQAIQTRLLGRTIGLSTDQIQRLALRPNAFHVIQLPPKPHRPILMLFNGTVHGDAIVRASFVN